MISLSAMVLCCVVQVTLFALVGVVVYALARRQGPRFGARLAAGILLAISLLTLFSVSPWPNWMTPSTANPAADSVSRAAMDGLGARQSDVPVVATSLERTILDDPAEMSWIATLRTIWSDLGTNAQPDSTALDAAAPFPWRMWFATAFAISALVGLVRLGGGWLGVAALKRRSVPLNDPHLHDIVDELCPKLPCPRPVSVRECPQLHTAATVGWRRPVLLLPAAWRDWQPGELRAVLAHELAHIERHDFATHALAQLGVAFHFYHPLVHWLANRLRLEQELAADALAARAIGGQRIYLNALARLALERPAARVSWPIHAFLPTRHTLVRRIEMLRDQTLNPTGIAPSPARRITAGWLTAIVLGVAAVAVAGLRVPSEALAQEAPARPNRDEAVRDQPANQSAGARVGANGDRYDFSWVPENFLGLVAIRPSELAADPRLAPLAKMLEENTRPGILSKSVEQMTLLFVAPNLDERGMPVPGSGGEQVIIHTNEAVDFATYLKKGYPTLDTADVEGRNLFVISSRPSSMSFYAPDKETLIGRVRTGLLELIENGNAADPPPGADAWQAEAKGPLLVVARGSALVLHGARDGVENILSMIVPLLNGAEEILATVEVADTMTLHGRIACKTPEDAAKAAETLNALAVLAENALRMQREQLARAGTKMPDAAGYRALFDLAENVLKKRQLKVDGNEVRFDAEIGNTTDSVRMIVDVLAPAVRASREGARRSVSMNNLKQIALAMLVYESANGHFPPAVFMGPDGKTPHSWRVALLPYLGGDVLHQQYRFDEPWDSENNRKLLERMPEVYRYPLDGPPSTHASYFVIAGPDTLFDDGDGTKLMEVTDGTSNTLLAVEAKREIPWTKPEDIPYAAGEAIAALGGWSQGGFNGALADGSVRFFSETVDADILRAMITKSGGEPVGAPARPGGTNAEGAERAIEPRHTPGAPGP